MTVPELETLAYLRAQAFYHLDLASRRAADAGIVRDGEVDRVQIGLQKQLENWFKICLELAKVEHTIHENLSRRPQLPPGLPNPDALPRPAGTDKVVFQLIDASSDSERRDIIEECLKENAFTPATARASNTSH